MVENWHLHFVRMHKYKGILDSKYITDLDIERSKWERSGNVKKYYNTNAQDIVECILRIWKPDYKDTEGDIKAQNRGTLPNMFVIQHLDCILEVNKVKVPLSTKYRAKGQ